MKNVLIIGGGFAGLASATFLCKNYNVTLIEKSKYLGGRAKSYLNENLNSYYDNGHHLLSGAYKNTIEFLTEIGAIDNFLFSEILTIPYITRGKKVYRFKYNTQSSFAKLLNFLRFNLLSIKQRLEIISLLITIQSNRFEYDRSKSANEFLKLNFQSQNTIEKFWKIISISIFNADLEDINSEIFIDVINKLFNDKNIKSLLVFPKYDLYLSYINSAEKYLNNNNVKILLDTNINEILFENNLVKAVRFNNKEYNFDYYICAISPYNLKYLFEEKVYDIFSAIDNLKYNSIISIHIWFTNYQFKSSFYYLLDSQLQWIFIRGNIISLVISNPKQMIELNNREITELTVRELKLFFKDFSTDYILDVKIIKEKRATFISDHFMRTQRPSQTTPYTNLFLAGDYTNTRLPSTIESAVTSAKICRDLIEKK